MYMYIYTHTYIHICIYIYVYTHTHTHTHTHFGHLMQTANSLEKTLMLGKIEGRRRRGRQRMKVKWLDDITNSMGMNLSKLQERVKGRKAWCAAVQGVRNGQAWLGDQTTTTVVNINTRGKGKEKEAAVPYVQLSNLMSTPISLLRPQFPTACSVYPLACQVCVLYVTGLRQSFYSLSTLAPLHSSPY